MSSEKPLIIAHRGASALAPENTFAAFGRAIADGADGIEFDVRLSKDGVPIVFHDATLQRLAGIERRAADLTAAELKEIDVGTWFNRAFPKKADGKFASENIPLLIELFEFLTDYQGLIYVELKGEDAMIFTLAEKVCELIGQTNLAPRIVVKSFNLESLKIIKRHAPALRTAALFEPTIKMVLRKKKYILDAARECGADEISIHYSLATRKFVRRAREENFPTLVWTADKPVWVRRASDYGISAIITNNPAVLLAERARIWRKT